MRSARTLALATGLLLIAPLAADDKPVKIGTVSGKVTFKGVPLPGGTVAFHPAEGKAVVAALGSDGSYSAKVPVGECRVTVETESLLKPPAKDEEKPPAEKAPPEKGEKPDPKKYVAIPKKYGDPKTTPLQVTVTEGKQTVDIKLTD